MSTYERREVATIRVEYHVPAPEPWGATWAEVSKAMTAAANELREHKGGSHISIADDEITVRPHDEDGIVVSFELRRTEAAS